MSLKVYSAWMTGRTNTSAQSVRVGDVFSRLTVIGPSVAGPGGRYFPCRCECGLPVFVKYARLSAGQKTCGCGEGRRTHGGANKEQLYSVWSNMLSRCRQPRNTAYHNYGGRGITVCAEWSKYAPFRDWAIANGYAPELQLDRRDNNGPYSPENCRWATPTQQAQNRRSNIEVTLDGETKVLREWARDARCVVSYATLYARWKSGTWDFATALSSPAWSKERGGDILK